MRSALVGLQSKQPEVRPAIKLAGPSEQGTFPRISYLPERDRERQEHPGNQKTSPIESFRRSRPPTGPKKQPHRKQALSGPPKHGPGTLRQSYIAS